MNKIAKQVFDIITGRCAGFVEERRKTFSDYTTRKGQARTYSSKFKDEAAIFETEHAKILDETRAELATQSKDFARKIRDCAAQLKTELTTHTSEPVNPVVLDKLRVYREFGVKPSRTEIEQLLEVNHGNTLGLAVIDVVLKENKAPYRVKYRSICDYENDITNIEELGRIAAGYSPMDAHSEACAVWAGQQVPGGIIGQTWDSTALMIQRHAFENALKQVQSAADSWVSDVAYQLVEEALPLEEDETPPPSSTSLAETGADPVEAVRASAKDQAALDAKAAGALKEYMH